MRDPVEMAKSAPDPQEPTDMTNHAASMTDPEEEEPTPDPGPGPGGGPSPSSDPGGNPDTGNEPNNNANDSRHVSILDKIIIVIKEAGTVGEENTTRGGAFSHKAETHAAAMGLAAGWFAMAQGDTQLLSIVYAAAVYGRNLEASGQRRRVIKDIINEPHYAIFFAVVGALLGSLTTGAMHGIDLLGDIPIPGL